MEKSSTARHLEDTDTTAAAAADSDNVGGDDAPQAEVKAKPVDDVQPGADTRDSRRELERHSATLYVSRLSRLIATLFSDNSVTMTSSINADRLLQQFASNFCTGAPRILHYHV